MQIKKRWILLIIFFLIFIIILVIFLNPVKKEELYGEYFEIIGFFGIFPPYRCCVFRTIDDKYFYDSRSLYKDFDKSEIIEHNSEEKCTYNFKKNILSFWLSGYEKVIRHWFSDKVESTGWVEYRVIKIGSQVILLGGDYNRILVKIDRKVKTSPNSNHN